MRLAWKLTLALGIGICVVQGLYAWVRIRREAALFESDTRRYHHVIGKSLAVATSKVWDKYGEAQTLDLVAEANERYSHVLVEWVSKAETFASGGVLDAQVKAAGASGREQGWIGTGADGERYLHTYVPVWGGGGRLGGLHLSETLAPEREYLHASVLRVAAGTAVTVAVTAAMTLVLGLLFVGRPVRQLVRLARRIGEGDLSGRLVVRHGDEIGLLAQELNGMCDRLAEARERVRAETASRLAAVEQLRHADRLATAGKLVAGIAHELGTPLNVAGGRAKAIAKGEVDGAAAAGNARIVVEQVDRMTRLIRQLLDFARRSRPQRSSADLGRLVQQTLDLLTPTAKKRQVMLGRAPDEGPCRAEVDAGQIQQVLTNLVLNAIQAMPNGGEVTLAIRPERVPTPAAPGGPAVEGLRIDVRDQGSGIPPDVLPQVFDPFFTTKDVGQGTGLGLSVSYGIVRDHGGWISVESEVGKGSVFSVHLPVGARAAEAPGRGNPGRAAPGGPANPPADPHRA